MRNLFKPFYIFFSFILILALSGCFAGVTVSKAPLLTEKNIQFLIPKNENIIGQNTFLKGLTYKNTLIQYYPLAGTSIQKVKGIEVEQRPNEKLLVITNHNGEYYPGTGSMPGSMYTSYIRYYIDVQLEERENFFVLTFRPKEKEIGEGRSPIGRAYEMPYFDESKLYTFLKTPVIKFTSEFDSPYNPESTYANFKRLLKISKKGYKDDVTGKIYTESFIIPKLEAELFVEVYPYRNGTKAVVTFHLPIKEDRSDNYIIDLGKLITETKRMTEEIVKN